MTITKDISIGQLVALQPLRAQVFDELGIDFCCGGKLTLEEACKNKQIELTVVLEKLKTCDAQVGDTSENFNESSLKDLADHIENTHHTYLKKELPRLSALAEKVARVHGEKEPRMIEVRDLFNKVKPEIEQHTMKEEMVLFPYIRDLESKKEHETPPFGTVANPINCMESDHTNLGEALEKLRSLTDDYTAPEGACGSWRALLGGLKQFDKDTRIHIHKESSILYPKAIEKEGQYSKN